MDERPQYDDVVSAARQLAGHAIRTPLLENEYLNARLGGRVLIKPEVLQRTGSFKFRGAYNRLSRLSAAEKANGVVAFSSGNHAQGVAYAAKLLGIHAVIVMPTDAPNVKVEGVRRYGGEIVSYDRATADRVAIANELVGRTGGIVVPSFDDPFIIAGQGTTGLEIAQDCEAMDVSPDLLLCGAGGGGLIAGTGLAMKRHFPQTEIWAVEPEDFDDHRRSLKADARVANKRLSGSIQDAILTDMPGALTFPINRKSLAGGLVVSDDDTLDAMAVAFAHLKLVVEPGGIPSLAALLSGKIALDGRTAVCILTGGNVDPAVFQKALERL